MNHRERIQAREAKRNQIWEDGTPKSQHNAFDTRETNEWVQELMKDFRRTEYSSAGGSNVAKDYPNFTAYLNPKLK